MTALVMKIIGCLRIETIFNVILGNYVFFFCISSSKEAELWEEKSAENYLSYFLLQYMNYFIDNTLIKVIFYSIKKFITINKFSIFYFFFFYFFFQWKIIIKVWVSFCWMINICVFLFEVKWVFTHKSLIEYSYNLLLYGRKKIYYTAVFLINFITYGMLSRKFSTLYENRRENNVIYSFGLIKNILLDWNFFLA